MARIDHEGNICDELHGYLRDDRTRRVTYIRRSNKLKEKKWPLRNLITEALNVILKSYVTTTRSGINEKFLASDTINFVEHSIHVIPLIFHRL